MARNTSITVLRCNTTLPYCTTQYINSKDGREVDNIKVVTSGFIGGFACCSTVN